MRRLLGTSAMSAEEVKLSQTSHAPALNKMTHTQPEKHFVCEDGTRQPERRDFQNTQRARNRRTWHGSFYFVVKSKHHKSS